MAPNNKCAGVFQPPSWKRVARIPDALPSCLAFIIAWKFWQWEPVWAALVVVPFLALDLFFFGANILRVTEGGWVPLVVASCVGIVIMAWLKGRAVTRERVRTQNREGGALAGEVADPELQARQAVEELGAFELLSQLAARGGFLQLAGLWPEVMALELEAAFVEPTRFVAHGLEIDGALAGHGERGLGQEECLESD